MRSAVNWALLGLVIERPSYAYDLAQRFERRYGSVLSLSNIGHVYTALSALGTRGLVQEIPGTREGRQPRPRYQSTPKGVDEYRAWLVSQVSDDRRRHELFVLALAALAREPGGLLEVVTSCEQEWLSEGMRTSIARDGLTGGPAGVVDDASQEGEGAEGEKADEAGASVALDEGVDRVSVLLERLIGEENRLAVGAKLEWVQYAREQLGEFTDRRSAGGRRARAPRP